MSIPTSSKNPIQPHETMIKHHEMVKALAKSGEQIAAEINADDAHLMHMAIGISGEAGELLDAIKKQVIYRKPLDRENVLEELGDLEFYMEGIRQGLGITREQCLEANIAKLSRRYEGMKYTDDAAQERADKQHPWYPKNSFRRFSKPVCGTSCKVCNGFALEIEEDRERPCPSCYPGPTQDGQGSIKVFQRGGGPDSYHASIPVDNPESFIPEDAPASAHDHE
jgi:NTP pyrophosphatase (non-canonical NTP hydrolase)